MLTRLIVDLYAWIIEIVLWILLVVAALAGFFGAVPMLTSIGLNADNALAWKVFSALALPLLVFLLLVVLLGPFLVLLDIRKSVRAFEASLFGSQGRATVPPLEYKEPHL
ncbi:MAG: hypothetical protein ABUU24_04450 [Variovorax sp.]